MVQQRAKASGIFWCMAIAGAGVLLLGAEQLLRGLWILWRSGSWSTAYRDPFFMDLVGPRAKVTYITTPSQSLRGEHLLISTFFVLLGVYLLWRALREARSR